MAVVRAAPFTVPRDTALPHRRVAEVLSDFLHIHSPPNPEIADFEARACVSCALPMCRSVEIGGCPLRNPINKWHQLMADGRIVEAAQLLRSSNPFPEFMVLCPAPCMDRCVAGHHFESIGIKSTEQRLFQVARSNGLIVAPTPQEELGIAIAIVGSGPAGLAAAWVLRQEGFTVHVIEASKLIGGLLTEGIPDFHLEKHLVDARVQLMLDAGIHFHRGIRVGTDEHPMEVGEHAVRIHLGGNNHQNVECAHVILALGASRPRDIPSDFPGRELGGIHQALEFLIGQNHLQRGLITAHPIAVEGQQVVVLGGGLTGLDVRSTALRRNHTIPGVVPLTVVRKPLPGESEQQRHWLSPMDSRLEVLQFTEGGETHWGATPIGFVDRAGAGTVTHLQVRLLDNTVQDIPATRVFLALGFDGPGRDPNGLVARLGLATDSKGFIETAGPMGATSIPRVLAVGDCTTHPQKLIVDAVAAGRDVARAIVAQHEERGSHH